MVDADTTFPDSALGTIRVLEYDAPTEICMLWTEHSSTLDVGQWCYRKVLGSKTLHPPRTSIRKRPASRTGQVQRPFPARCAWVGGNEGDLVRSFHLEYYCLWIIGKDAIWYLLRIPWPYGNIASKICLHLLFKLAKPLWTLDHVLIHTIYADGFAEGGDRSASAVT